MSTSHDFKFGDRVWVGPLQGVVIDEGFGARVRVHLKGIGSDSYAPEELSRTKPLVRSTKTRQVWIDPSNGYIFDNEPLIGRGAVLGTLTYEIEE